jgi:hypothetical protein
LRSPRHFRLVIALVALLVATSVPAAAQQPFVVDDADVTPSGEWHVEISNQIDRLKGAVYPARWQNTFEWEVDVGVGGRIEAALVAPLISIVNDHRVAANVTGIGDSALGLKLRLTKDPDARHSLAATVALEMPTGSRSRELGSGLTDYGLNAISQHRLRDDLMLRLNLGWVFAGNLQTGVIGIRERGTVVTTGASLVRTLSAAIQFGAEVVAGWSEKESIRSSAVGWQIGSSVLIHPGMTLDLGISASSAIVNPILGLQVGTSIDLNHLRTSAAP